MMNLEFQPAWAHFFMPDILTARFARDAENAEFRNGYVGLCDLRALRERNERSVKLIRNEFEGFALQAGCAVPGIFEYRAAGTARIRSKINMLFSGVG